MLIEPHVDDSSVARFSSLRMSPHQLMRHALNSRALAQCLFSSPFCTCMYSCGAWSPSRAAVLFIGRTDGIIDIW